MIPQAYITEWSNFVPWQTNDQVEQDLIISRTLVALFSDAFLREHLAFRGGTALHKLYLNPAPRYSEDIDLVQIKEGPIKPILKRIDEVITFFEENRVVKQKENNNTILYRFTSESGIRGRLKIEINCREHFSLLGWISFPFAIESQWFSGECKITTYNLEELLGTKLRALYQRKKGRDLFDLFYASRHANFDNDKLIYCYREYMKFTAGNSPSQKEFIRNIEQKKQSVQFSGDIQGLLNPDLKYNQEEAFEWLFTEIIPKIN